MSEREHENGPQERAEPEDEAMNEPREKILGLVAAGKLSTSEGQLLLGALKPARRQVWKWLFSPFELASPSTVWMVAVGVCVASLALSQLGIRFDGAIDLHLADSRVSWWTALLDQAVAWPLSALVFWLLSPLTRRRARLPEVLGFVGAARLPYLLAALVVAAVGARSNLAESKSAALVIGLTVTPLLIWTCSLLYTGLRTATGSRGPRLTLTFFAALLLAEVSSKLILGALS